MRRIAYVPSENAGFDVMVTADQSIKYQQNLTGCRIAIVVLGSNAWPVLKPRGPDIAALVNAAAPGSYEFMEFPEGHKWGHHRRPK